MTRRVPASWITRSALTASAAAVALAGAVTPALAQEATTSAGPKNVIVLIGDGMGYNHIDAANLYTHGQSAWQVQTDAQGRTAQVGGPTTQRFESWDHVAMTTIAAGGSYDAQASWDDFDHTKRGATDSAAAGTAMATGTKVRNGALGIDPEGHLLPNITDRAVALGKAAGVVSSVQIPHATPASFVAQNPSRNNYQTIATQMIDSDLSVILGAGHPWYDDDATRLDTPNHAHVSAEDYQRLADGQTDWTFVEDNASFQDLREGETPERLFGLVPVATTLQQARTSTVAGVEQAPYATALTEGVPSLADLTQVALNVLEEDEDGFFVMIEGGAIDWTGHANDTARNIEETIDFNASVDAVIDWVEENSSWDETMVIVTADHETGYLAGQDSTEAWTAMTGAAGRTPAVEWYSGNHTNHLVPVFAKGAGTEQLFSRATGVDPVRGAYLDNTDLANVLLEDLWAHPAAGDGDIPVTAEIPGGDEEGTDPVGPGSLVLSVAPGTAQLGDARNSGDHLRLSGTLPAVSVTDSRTAGAGWNLTGQSSDLVSGDAVLRADRLGWAPYVAAGTGVPGPEVAPAVGAGLAVPAILGSASGETRVGTTEFGADLELRAPVTTEAGTYAGGITVSLFPQD